MIDEMTNFWCGCDDWQKILPQFFTLLLFQSVSRHSRKLIETHQNVMEREMISQINRIEPNRHWKNDRIRNGNEKKKMKNFDQKMKWRRMRWKWNPNKKKTSTTTFEFLVMRVKWSKHIFKTKMTWNKIFDFANSIFFSRTTKRQSHKHK